MLSFGVLVVHVVRTFDNELLNLFKTMFFLQYFQMLIFPTPSPVLLYYLWYCSLQLKKQSFLKFNVIVGASVILKKDAWLFCILFVQPT